MRPPPPEPWLCRTKLQAAAYYGHTQAVETLLAMGVPVDETDERGKTALMFAAVNGHVGVVEKLLAAGADVNRDNRIDPSTALLYATDRGHICVVEALLRAGAHTHVTNNYGQCALTMACRDGMLDVVKKLLAFGADVNQHVQNNGVYDFDGYTPLIYAIRECHTCIVEALLAVGAALEEVDANGYTALLQACENGTKATVLTLVAAGANVQHVSSVGGCTALHLAVWGDRRDCCELIDLLVAEGADVDAMDGEGKTALAFALRYDNPRVVATLLAAGATVNFPNWSPLHAAYSRGGDPAPMQLLLDAGADVNCRNARGNTPLMTVAAAGQNHVVELLLHACADVDAVNLAGDTALGRAEQARHVATAELIRDFRAHTRFTGRSYNGPVATHSKSMRPYTVVWS